MEWIKIKINTSKTGLDFVSQIFEGCGVVSLEIEDCEEFLQVLEQTRLSWNYIEDELYNQKSKACSVAAYLANNNSGKETLKLIEKKISAAKSDPQNKKYGSLELFISSINEEDWAENWKKYFKPVPVGENILICPVWEEVPEEYKHRVIFKIDPGMCFGTGTHETTRLCAEALERYVKCGDLVLDLGCGSGILFIIALLFGAREAVGVDIDEYCAHIAKNNASANGIAQKNYKVYTGDLLSDAKLLDEISGYKYNIILINIVPDIIIPLLPVVKDLLADGGVCVLSGIIEKYLPEVECAAGNAGYKIAGITSENGWQCAVIKK